MSENYLDRKAEFEHVQRICDEAGLSVMTQVLQIVRDRGEISATALLDLDADDVYAMYERWVGSAIDSVEADILEREES